MNFYPFHIGDYASHTKHLSLMEDLAYRRLLDLYYTNERALPTDPVKVAELIGMCEQLQEVCDVLSDFFHISKEGYTHKRCEKVISDYKMTKNNHWTKNLSKSQRAAFQAKRNASKVSATPKWLTTNHKEEIAIIYAWASTLTEQTGVRHEVDHVVPIRSRVVCGLHVPWNLQVITAEKNRLKSNLFEVS